MTDENPPVLWISADVSGLSRHYHVTEREHVSSDPWVPKAKADASRRRAKLLRHALSDAKATIARQQVMLDRALEVSFQDMAKELGVKHA